MITTVMLVLAANAYPFRSIKPAGGNGARAMSRALKIGSLHIGKSADSNRNIIDLADTGHADQIAATRVLETWFMGKRVYSAAH